MHHEQWAVSEPSPSYRSGSFIPRRDYLLILSLQRYCPCLVYFDVIRLIWNIFAIAVPSPWSWQCAHFYYQLQLPWLLSPTVWIFLRKSKLSYSPIINFLNFPNFPLMKCLPLMCAFAFWNHDVSRIYYKVWTDNERKLSRNWLRLVTLWIIWCEAFISISGIIGSTHGARSPCPNKEFVRANLNLNFWRWSRKTASRSSRRPSYTNIQDEVECSFKQRVSLDK